MGELRSLKESYAHPILDSVGAQQEPSRLLHCGAKSARRAPTWTPSPPPGWGSWSSCPSLLALSWVGSIPGSSAGSCTKGLVLWYGPLDSRGRRWPQALKHWSPSLALGWASRTYLVALLGLLDEDHWRTRHPICLPDGSNPVLQNLCFRHLGRGGFLRFLPRVLLLFDGWHLQSIFLGVELDRIIHGVVSSLGGSCRITFLLLLQRFVQRSPCFRKPVFADVTRRFLDTKRQTEVVYVFWSGSSPGTWAAAPETKTGHVTPPSCFVDRKRATFHANQNKWQMRRRKASTPATDWRAR